VNGDEEVMEVGSEKRNSDKESLQGLERELQEALIVEDLLFVLMVRPFSPFLHRYRLTQSFLLGYRRTIHRI
jgi:hypothetical protein